MPKVCYVSKKFRDESLLLIEHANSIIASYQSRGFSLTLRQLYYQFVSRDLFPASWASAETGSTNNEKSYKKLGNVVSDGRRAGLIDWEAIVDRTRNVTHPSSWKEPADMVRACAEQYDTDWWLEQEYRPEVWVEKDALVGVIETACAPWRCPYFSCRGYTSDSEIWDAGQRFKRVKKFRGQTPVVIHLGDHDPSGIDMSRDIRDRLKMFAGADVEVRRIALTMDQVTTHNPPPNPAKSTDSRYKDYEELHGDESWELDALSPEIIAELIADEMNGMIDPGGWEDAQKRRDEGRAKLRFVSDNWEKSTKGWK